MVLLRLHLLSSCSHFVSAQQAGLHNSDRRHRGSFFRRGKREAFWHRRRDNVPCVLNKPLEPKQPNPTAYQHCACNDVMVHVCCFSLDETWFNLQDSAFVHFCFWLSFIPLPGNQKIFPMGLALDKYTTFMHCWHLNPPNGVIKYEMGIYLYQMSCIII